AVRSAWPASASAHAGTGVFRRLRRRMCLPWSLRAGTERGVYAASAWHNPAKVACLIGTMNCPSDVGQASSPASSPGVPPGVRAGGEMPQQLAGEGACATGRFVESLLSLLRMHYWDHELPVGCSAGVLACEFTGRPARCSCWRRDAAATRRRDVCATGRSVESLLSLLRIHYWDHELPVGCSAGVLACEFTGRPARCSCWRRDAAATRRRGRLRYRTVHGKPPFAFAHALLGP